MASEPVEQATNSELLPVPGLEMVGRGVYLRPYRPYELKDVIFKRENERPYYSQETGKTYAVPEGYSVNDSPPMPTKQALNQVVIEESWERFEKQSNLDANLTVSNAPFSVDINASQTSQLRSEEDSYYALRTSFIPLWTIYLPNTTNYSEDIFNLDIPIPFQHKHRRVYEKFFDQYGTHFVQRVWVGGKAMLAFTIAKSSQMSKEEIQAGIKASFMLGGSTSVDSNLQSSKEALQHNSECTVFGKGGNELQLATLSSLDEARYNEWLKTIQGNPQIIEFEAKGIWTLIHDEDKAKALLDAYKEATTFTPISAVVSIDRQVYFLRDNKYMSYDIEKSESKKPRPIGEKWPALLEVGFERVDAVFKGDHLVSVQKEDLDRKLFFFRRDKCLRLDIDTNKVDPGYPMPIAEAWPGIDFTKIDAALNVGADTVYFFSGNQYCRYNMATNSVDEGYPEPIGKRWAGVTFDRIDAALYWGGGKIYFFRGDQNIRYDITICRADPGYPKFIVGSYIEDWKFFS